MIIHVVQIQKKRYCQTWHPVEEKVKNYSRVSLINNRPKSGSGRETAMADKADCRRVPRIQYLKSIIYVCQIWMAKC